MSWMFFWRKLRNCFLKTIWIIFLKNMIENKKIIVVLPAYNAEKILEKTYQEIPKDIVDIYYEEE